jgi:hypothetical protein
MKVLVNALTGQVEFQYGTWPLILHKIYGSQNKPRDSRGRNVRTCGPLDRTPSAGFASMDLPAVR